MPIPQLPFLLDNRKQSLRSIADGPASIAGGLAFLRCGGSSPPDVTRSTKTHVTHRRIKIERVYRPYLTAAEPLAGDGAPVALTAILRTLPNTFH
jgi:hypothetical protein